MRERFICTPSGLYFSLTAEEEKVLLICTATRSYKIEQDDHSKRRVEGVKRELDPNAGIDLLIAAEAMANEHGLPVHLQTEDGFTVDLIAA
jgi:hypothetical protein